jgi:hypothetical protein
MKKILLLPLIAAAAFAAPQPAAADTSTASLDAPYCQRSPILPVSVGVRCYNGSKFCNVWVYVVDQDLGVRPNVCV